MLVESELTKPNKMSKNNSPPRTQSSPRKPIIKSKASVVNIILMGKRKPSWLLKGNNSFHKIRIGNYRIIMKSIMKS